MVQGVVQVMVQGVEQGVVQSLAQGVVQVVVQGLTKLKGTKRLNSQLCVMEIIFLNQ